MADLALPTGDLISVLLAEARRRMVTLTTLFAVIAVAALLIGITLPRKYESSTTILVQESNIVTGLMEGRAVATGVADRASIAREVIFSRKVLSGILETGGWLVGNPSPLDQDRMSEAITKRTTISSPRDNLIQIAYSDSDPPTRGWDAVFRERIPGAAGQDHSTIAGASHFVQEQQGEQHAHSTHPDRDIEPSQYC